MNFIGKIGRDFLNFLNLFFSKVGKVSLFMYNCIKAIFSKKWYFKNLAQQFLEIGFYSLPVVTATAIFTGAVMALQTYAGCNRFGAESTVPAIVVLAITRELAPILVGLMVAGRISTSIAAQIGTMKVSEQIDALYTLSTSPFKYLMLPRIIAATVSMPFLVLFADIIGIFGGTIASVVSLDFDLYIYLNNTMNFLQYEDVYSGLIKSIVFGFIIALSGCYCGYNSKGGAEGVGKATINAIVYASIGILLTNYFMTEIFFI